MTRLGILVLLCSCAATPAQDAKVALVWKKDAPLRYSVRHMTKVTKGGNVMKSESSFEITLTAADGDIVVKTERYCLKRGQIDYDSAKGGGVPQDAGARMMAAHVGKSYCLPMSSAGEFKPVRDIDQFVEAVAKDMGGNVEYNRSLLHSVRGPEQLRHEMQSTFPALSGKALAEGDSWEAADGWSLADVGKMASKIVCTLKDIKGGEAHIVELTTFSKTQGVGELKEGKRTAELIFDIAAGRLKSLKGTTTLSFVANTVAQTTEIQFETKLLDK